MVRQTNRMLGSHFDRFLSDESGATAIEYCILAVFLALAISAAILAVGESISLLYESAAEPFYDETPDT